MGSEPATGSDDPHGKSVRAVVENSACARQISAGRESGNDRRNDQPVEP
jgi:hypothetical protein